MKGVSTQMMSGAIIHVATFYTVLQCYINTKETIYFMSNWIVSNFEAVSGDTKIDR